MKCAMPEPADLIGSSAELFSLNEVAEILAVGHPTVTRLIRAGLLKSKLDPNDGVTVLVERVSLLALIKTLPAYDLAAELRRFVSVRVVNRFKPKRPSQPNPAHAERMRAYYRRRDAAQRATQGAA